MMRGVHRREVIVADGGSSLETAAHAARPPGRRNNGQNAGRGRPLAARFAAAAEADWLPIPAWPLAARTNPHRPVGKLAVGASLATRKPQTPAGYFDLRGDRRRGPGAPRARGWERHRAPAMQGSGATIWRTGPLDPARPRTTRSRLQGRLGALMEDVALVRRLGPAAAGHNRRRLSRLGAALSPLDGSIYSRTRRNLLVASRSYRAGCGRPTEIVRPSYG